jgi:hypothetical protein
MSKKVHFSPENGHFCPQKPHFWHIGAPKSPFFRVFSRGEGRPLFWGGTPGRGVWGGVGGPPPFRGSEGNARGVGWKKFPVFFWGKNVGQHFSWPNYVGAPGHIMASPSLRAQMTVFTKKTGMMLRCHKWADLWHLQWQHAAPRSMFAFGG